MSRIDPDVLDWLLAGDPSIRWQTLEGLVGAPPGDVAAERARVAETGWGALLLAAQDPEGTWDHGLYTPKWTSTTYTMLLLRELGLPSDHPQAARGCELLLDAMVTGPITGRLWASDTCVAGLVLSIASAFAVADARVDWIAGHLLGEQMPDGGWNCRYRRDGSTHASMNTTILALEGLLAYERHRARQTRQLRAVRAAQRRGREFLLVHRLYRSHRTGSVIQSSFTRCAFPPQWHFDVLRALDHFRDVDAPRDPRLAEAIDLLRAKQRPDGRWALEHRWPGREWLRMESVGAPSRWTTLRALRVLRWWDGPASAGGGEGSPPDR